MAWLHGTARTRRPQEVSVAWQEKSQDTGRRIVPRHRVTSQRPGPPDAADNMGVAGGGRGWAELPSATQPRCRGGSHPLHPILAPLPTAPSPASTQPCCRAVLIPVLPVWSNPQHQRRACGAVPAVGAAWVSPGRCVRAQGRVSMHPWPVGGDSWTGCPPCPSAQPLPQRVRQETPTAAAAPRAPGTPDRKSVV